MMAYSEDHIVLAAEYALGTLDAGERVQVQTMMAVDREFAAICEAWEYRLSVLNQMVGLVEPRAEVWERIKAAITRPTPTEAAPVKVEPGEMAQPEPGKSGSAADMIAPDLQSPVPTETVDAPVEAAEVVEASQHPAVPGQAAPVQGAPSLAAERGRPAPTGDSNVVQLASKVRQWRTVANAMTALAAVLLAMIAVQVYRPDLLPDVMRPKPRAQTAEEVKAAAGQFVALLQKDGASPAFILTVDAGTKNFTVRKVGAEAEPGKSYELWLVSDKFQKPRSLGVIGGGDFTNTPALSSYDSDTVNSATYAVSVEPEGGSPTGVATGPIVFTGKLIETVPPAVAPR
jgi:anti-sigma-K factor RskA